MTDRVPGMPGRCTGLVTGEELQKLQSGEPFAITLRRDDQPIKEGTPYSKAAVLPDALASALCPEVDDPAPKDAFAALQEKKADSVQRKTGTIIAANNCAHTPLKGLKLFGKTTESGSVGDSGSVTVNIIGKNLLAHPYAESSVTRNGITFTAGEDGCVTINGTATAGANLYLYESKPSWLVGGKTYISSGHRTDLGVRVQIMYKNENGVMQYKNAAFTWQDNYTFSKIYISVDKGNTLNNLLIYPQFEIGTQATEYEPYKQPQTLTVAVPGGLKSDGSVCDEVDFSRGMIVRRVDVEYPAEVPLTAEELENYAALHTYSPHTTVYNDSGADMELTYYTPSTAVQMVHGANDAGKYLSIDKHGCVYPAKITVNAEDVQYLNETIDARFVILQADVLRVIHQQQTDGWYCHIWSNNFIELYKKDLQTLSIADSGTVEVSYDLPFGLTGDPVVNVTACGKVFLRDIVKVDEFTLLLIFEGEPGASVSNINISITGFTGN